MNNVVEFTPEVILAGEKTEQEWVNDGVALRKRSERTYRDVGEWYAGVKAARENSCAQEFSMSLKEIIEKAGFSANYPADALRFITAFPTEESQQGFTIMQCAQLLLPAYKVLGHDEFHGRFMSDAKAGERYNSDPDPEYTYTGPWNDEDIVRQVKLVRGIALPTKSAVVDAVTKGLGNDIEEVLTHSKLTKKAQTEVKRAVKKAEKELKGKFHDEVNAAVDSAVDEQVKEAREEAEAQRRASKSTYEKYKREEKLAKNRAQGLSALISKAEYKFLLQLLHPDRAPEGMHDKYEKGFQIIKKIGAGENFK